MCHLPWISKQNPLVPLLRLSTSSKLNFVRKVGEICPYAHISPSGRVIRTFFMLDKSRMVTQIFLDILTGKINNVVGYCPWPAVWQLNKQLTANFFCPHQHATHSITGHYCIFWDDHLDTLSDTSLDDYFETIKVGDFLDFLAHCWWFIRCFMMTLWPAVYLRQHQSMTTYLLLLNMLSIVGTHTFLECLAHFGWQIMWFCIIQYCSHAPPWRHHW